MTTTTTDRWLLAATLGVALVLRIIAAHWWEERVPATQKFGFPDSEGYWELARTIAHGKPYEFGPEKYRIFRTPGYPALLAPLFLIWDEPPTIAARYLGAIFGTMAVLLTGWIASLVAGSAVSKVATLGAAIYPEAIASSVFLLSEAPFIPLMLLQVGALILMVRSTDSRSQLRWGAMAGACAGLATLVRPSWLLFTPLAAVMLVALLAPRGRSLNWSAAMMAALVAVMIPWWTRNYFVAGEFVPTSLQVGASLYDGLSPTATGASDMRFVAGFIDEQKSHDLDPAEQASLSGTFEARLDDRMKLASIEWAMQHPARVAELAIVKFTRIWSPLPNAAEFRSTMLRAVLFVSYLPTMLLAFAGSWKIWQRGERWPLTMLWLPAIYFTLLHTIFVSSIRYRQPAMFLIIVLTAIGLCALGKLDTRSPALAEKTA